jgi:hypothetical protein
VFELQQLSVLEPDPDPARERTEGAHEETVLDDVLTEEVVWLLVAALDERGDRTGDLVGGG